jgi:acyl transferase domain-containing protein
MKGIASCDSYEAGGINIAVIGMGCRFPGARNVESFWDNLRRGVESVSFFSDEELLAAGVDPIELRHPGYVKAAAILGDVEQFDAHFFGYSPRDAELLDPQQRIFLECVWEALENAGYQPDNCGVSVGVYAGVGFNTYLRNNILANPRLAESINPYQLILLNDKDFLASRVSYKLNLKGPSVVVQTACSTSLVAVHLACQSLLSYECDMAVAGGVTVRVPEVSGYIYKEGGVTSPDGHCRAFDAKARGMIGGNGAGVVVLKRLEEALADRDQILAVIKGSAINNDGAGKVGFTAPSIDGQAEAIRAAQAIAGVEPETVGYIEAHGTGTTLGDPIEIAALTQAFGAGSGSKNFCAIGSVKTNIGHLDVAAGVANLIKAVLVLQHGTIPPSLHFESPNPRIDFANSPFFVNAKAREWRTVATPRRAGVSSFGMGGTNSHVVLEEARAEAESAGSRPWALIALSARSEAALNTATANLASHLSLRDDLDLADVAFTLHTGRKSFDHRRVAVCRDTREAVSLLTSREPLHVFTGAVGEVAPEVVFMFPGQGSQYVGMGRELYEREPAFRAEVDRCAELLKPETHFDIREILYPVEAAREEAERRIDQTFFTQIALFVVEYAMARLWMSWGVRPRAMVGHSIGEYVAACLAGVMSLEDALRLVALRGRLMQEAPRGLMLAVSLGEEELEPLLPEAVSLAAVNGPASCVVSGAAPIIESFESRLLGQGVKCRRLRTSHAFHSEMMQPVSERFVAAMRDIRLQSPRAPYLSNLTGAWIKEEEATSPDYWANHLRHTVRFWANAQELLKMPANQVILEVGPGQTLGAMTKRSFTASAERLVLSSMRWPQQEVSDVEFLLTSLGRLWLAGVEVSWRDFYAAEPRRRVALPTYPFERQRYWIEAPGKEFDTRTTPLHRNPNVDEWLFAPAWKRTLPPAGDVTTSQQWLLFLDECGLGEEIGRVLSEIPQNVVTVRKGSCFRRLSVTSYEIDQRRQDDYYALLKELQERGQFPDRIVYLCAVTADDCHAPTIETFDEIQETVFNSLLRLTQALATAPAPARAQLCVVSNGMQMVTGGEALRPEKATLLGLCKVIPLELPNITCRSLDVTLPAAGELPGRLSKLMAAELLSSAAEPVVAYRRSQRWAQTFENAPVGAVAMSGVRIKEDGVYLITGGLGKIGLLLASHIAETPGVRLVLVGRSIPPVVEDWETWQATDQAHDETAQKLRALRDVKALGAEVVVAEADVADRRRMRSVLDDVRSRFGRLDGVIHAAGLVGESWLQPIQDTDWQLVEAHFRPKAHGLLVLDELLRDFSPDFCILVSSLSSILGGVGYAAYASANSFMDALAQGHNVKDGAPWMSVNWDGWQTQVAPEAEVATASPTQLGIVAREGVRAFARLLPLTGMAPQLVVSTADLDARIQDLNARIKRFAGRRERTSAAHETAGEAAAPTHRRAGVRGDYVAPASELERNLAEVWEDALGIDRIGVYDSFFELGGDSLLATHILPQLRENLQVELTLRDVFETPTIAGLASLVAQRRQEREFAHEAEILKMIERLSEREIEAELNRRTQTAEIGE